MKQLIYPYGTRCNQTYITACKIADRILQEGYTETNRLKCLMLVAKEKWKPAEESKVEQIKEILKKFDAKFPYCADFYVMTPAELEKEHYKRKI